MLTRLATLTAVAAAATLPAFAQAAPSAAGPSIMSQVLLFLIVFELVEQVIFMMTTPHL
ncbi:hypothetical protein [Hyphomonas atlantica]|uniref:hypothetical protein n=1 Tax=Hyphomonas atlantica TaxID=1280948 RepID=UPI0035197F87